MATKTWGNFAKKRHGKPGKDFFRPNFGTKAGIHSLPPVPGLVNFSLPPGAPAQFQPGDLESKWENLKENRQVGLLLITPLLPNFSL